MLTRSSHPHPHPQEGGQCTGRAQALQAQVWPRPRGPPWSWEPGAVESQGSDASPGCRPGHLPGCAMRQWARAPGGWGRMPAAAGQVLGRTRGAGGLEPEAPPQRPRRCDLPRPEGAWRPRPQARVGPGSAGGWGRGEGSWRLWGVPALPPWGVRTPSATCQAALAGHEAQFLHRKRAAAAPDSQPQGRGWRWWGKPGQSCWS